ncbi:DUF421 domain-containing protein [Nesterenkonia sp. LB17]|uniref:DUF421 domain-containing protein n=1 Tax=unclassified Nesterenkonia TaxID=2629769 RepID=UPI001F4C5672|nr:MULTISPECIES: YetF domain-containing protein [unclassified Nesterenkonia]MCH8559467.1 DUF421 domain-containing protein [Nesterenkonia sp. DZ6]MCH8561644.1 DUF421 domain-containing protein [Nesterenkonia sp. YGD6]MCH8564841.1 DUF421 domain-containing protein [Nesterenkonia sp. LB17]
MDMTQFWDGWDPIIHTVITLTAGYIALLIILRLSGPRTMASMTPLDFIVAVTIGSAFGRTLTAVDVPLSQAILTVLLLVLLQWLMAWMRGRSPKMRRILDAPPVLIYYQGKFQRKALRKHQLVEDDIHTAVRSSSRGSLKEVSAVILEQNGGLVVIGDAELDDSSSVLKFTGEAEDD